MTIKMLLLKNAVKIAEKKGYMLVTFQDVADSANTSTSKIQYYFRSIEELRDEIIDQSILEENYQVICQAIAMKKNGLQISDGIFNKAIEHLKRYYGK